MCLVGMALQEFEGWPLVLVANRDEYHRRPTQPLHAWSTEPVIFAGRDLEAGGTWMGANERGQIAVLTNLRGHPLPSGRIPSRGELVSSFLSSGLAAEVWLSRLKAIDSYAGFNLLISDNGRQFHLISNAGDHRVVDGGVHAISNGRLDEPWPKTQTLCAALHQLSSADSPRGLAALMEDTDVAPDHELPQTGVSLDVERMLAPRLIIGDEYGTRSTSVLRMNNEGQLFFTEFTRDIAGQVVSEVSVSVIPSP